LEVSRVLLIFAQSATTVLRWLLAQTHQLLSHAGVILVSKEMGTSAQTSTSASLESTSVGLLLFLHYKLKIQPSHANKQRPAALIVRAQIQQFVTTQLDRTLAGALLGTLGMGKVVGI
jgi:hypothetical protein